MNLLLQPGALTGSVSAIPSKSAAHRLLICAALADGVTRLRLGESSLDIDATIRCLNGLCASIRREGSLLTVLPGEPASPGEPLDCGESGSTFRFLLPVAGALLDRASFIGGGRLPERPIGELRDAMAAHGVVFSGERLPFTISGGLRPGIYTLPGNVSSQYLSGLLLALPLLDGDSELRLSTPLESRGYVEMTLGAVARFGISIEPIPQGWRIPGNQRYHSPGTVTVEGDWSNAAFFLAAGALFAPVTVTGLSQQTNQGDMGILKQLSRFGARIAEGDDTVAVLPSPSLQGCAIDVSDIPDLLPILSVVAAYASGETRFFGGARLRMKESDRIASSARMLEALGGQATQLPDGLIVRGTGLAGGTVDSCHDHRIVMAAAIVALGCKRPVTILDAGAVEKSYPRFFTDYASLGGYCHVF